MSELLSKLWDLRDYERAVAGGAVLFHRGDSVGSLFVVVEGEVQLTRTDETGKSLILQRASAGSILAEASIFSDVYHCDAIASAPSKAFAVAKPLLRQRLSTDAALAEAWAAYLARQVQQARFRCEILALRTVAERLDMWLSWQDDARASRTWLSVAREIGVSPEALYRELAKRRLR